MSLVTNELSTKSIPERIAQLMTLAIQVNNETNYAVNARFDGRTDEFQIEVRESAFNLADTLAVASIRIKPFPFEEDADYEKIVNARILHVTLQLQNTIRTGVFDTNGLKRRQPDFRIEPYSF